MSNQAAWIKESKGKPLRVEDAASGKPGSGQILIKNSAIAINPVDWKIQVTTSLHFHRVLVLIADTGLWYD